MICKNKFPKENIYFETEKGILYNNDVLNQLKEFPDESIDCVVTSPPYYCLRDYGVEGQLGVEPTFQEYLEKLWGIFEEVYRVLKPTGTVWVNLGDTYNGNKKGKTDKKVSECLIDNTQNLNKTLQKGIKKKSLCMIPERFAIGMLERGYILRNQIIWHKINAMPSSANDRFNVDFEKIFFFVKQQKYFFEQQIERTKAQVIESRMLKEQKDIYNGKYDHIQPKRSMFRNKRVVWSINTEPFSGSHFACFPREIPQNCIKAGCPETGIVLDIFMGSGTTGFVAEQLKRNWIGIELKKENCGIAKKRIKSETAQMDLF